MPFRIFEGIADVGKSKKNLLILEEDYIMAYNKHANYPRNTSCNSKKVVNVSISEIEDKLLNPLNTIMVLTFNTPLYIPIAREIQRIITTLEDKQIINPRRRSSNN